MTDITLGSPVDVFYWRGSVPGELCGGRVSWACTYESDEPIAIPPFIDYAGAHVIVTNVLPECEPLPSYVSPGVLTLTPTVTCPNPDPGGDPIATVLDPLTLTIAGSGGCDFCPYPENPGFETGIATPWFFGDAAVISEDVVHTGTYSVYLPLNGSTPGYISQSKTVCPPYPANIDLDFYVYGGGYPGDTHAVDVIIEQYQDSSVLDITEFPNQWVVVGEWTLISVSVPSQSTMNILTIKVANAGEDGSYVDDFTMNLCPVVVECPMNLSFEDGMSGWSVQNVTSTATRAHEGTYSAESQNFSGGWMEQRVEGLTGLQATIDVTFWLYCEYADELIDVTLKQYNSGNVKVAEHSESYYPAANVWSQHTISMSTHVDAVTLEMLFWVDFRTMWIDDISVNFGCSEVILP